MIYAISRFAASIYYLIFFRIKVIGAENIPKKGGFVLCSNHSTNHDPVVLGCAVNRPIRYIAKKELFRNNFLAFFFKNLNTIIVDREKVGMSTFKRGIETLKQGNILGVFAQGKRMDDAYSKEAKAGVALFATMARVPVIPVCISSPYTIFSKIYVNIGKPITLEEYWNTKLKSAQLNEITEKIMNEITLLKI